MSACLPGVIEPMRSSRPAILAAPGRHPGQRVATGQRRTLRTAAGLAQRLHDAAVALVLQRQPHAGEQVAAHGRLDVGPDRDRRVGGVQDAGERIAVAHLQFDLGSDRERSAAVRDPAHRVGRDIVAMNDCEVLVDQPLGPAIARTRSARGPVPPPTCMLGEQIELAGQRQVRARDVIGRVIRSKDRQPEGQEPVAAREPALAEPLDLPRPRHRHLAEMPLAGLGVRLGRAVQEQRADARLVQAADGGVAVLGGRIVVAPVHQRGRAWLLIWLSAPIRLAM